MTSVLGTSAALHIAFSILIQLLAISFTCSIRVFSGTSVPSVHALQYMLHTTRL